MNKRLVFKVMGAPRAKARARSSARAFLDSDGKPQAIVSVHSDPRMVADEATIAAEFTKASRAAVAFLKPATGPVKVTVEAIFAIPPSWPKYLREAAATGTLYHVSKPDEDNVSKLVKDALNERAYHDDSQVAVSIIVKRYGTPERTVITIEELDQADLPPTPGQKRVEARVAAVARGEAPQPPRRNTPKSETGKRPPALQARIDQALARDAAANRKRTPTA